MFLAKVYITFKPGINDPEGQTIRGSLQQLGFDTALDVRVGKYIQVRLDETSEEAAADAVRGMCDKLLANPVIEEYRFELEDVDRTHDFHLETS